MFIVTTNILTVSSQIIIWMENPYYIAIILFICTFIISLIAFSYILPNNDILYTIVAIIVSFMISYMILYEYMLFGAFIWVLCVNIFIGFVITIIYEIINIYWYYSVKN